MSVFTPADEPYLGRPSVRALDEMIVRFLQVQEADAHGTTTMTRAGDFGGSPMILIGAHPPALNVDGCELVG